MSVDERWTKCSEKIKLRAYYSLRFVNDAQTRKFFDGLNAWVNTVTEYTVSEIFFHFGSTFSLAHAFDSTSLFLSL